jgi:hypothetical protein
MLRQMLVGGMLVVTALLGSADAGDAGVSVDIGLHLGSTPRLMPVPSSPVLYAPGLKANFFSYAGQYYLFADRAWYTAPGYSGPWSVLAPEHVPEPILSVPVKYYRAPPPEWAGWRHDLPPSWEPEGGWQREERHQAQHDERHAWHHDPHHDWHHRPHSECDHGLSRVCHPVLQPEWHHNPHFGEHQEEWHHDLHQGDHLWREEHR